MLNLCSFFKIMAIYICQMIFRQIILRFLYLGILIFHMPWIVRNLYFALLLMFYSIHARSFTFTTFNKKFLICFQSLYEFVPRNGSSCCTFLVRFSFSSKSLSVSPLFLRTVQSVRMIRSGSCIASRSDKVSHSQPVRDHRY